VFIISLDVEETKEYKEAIQTMSLLEILIEYYQSNKNFDELELGSFKVRDLFAFMSDHEFPKRQFLDNIAREEIVAKINTEIKQIKDDLKSIRLKEIKDKNLRSLVVIPSWSGLIKKKVLGFYLNRPVIDVRKDTVVMLNRQIDVKQDHLGKNYTLITGPGILYTEFSLDPGNYITNIRPINMLVLPIDLTNEILDSPPMFSGDLKDATLTERMAIIPFDIIEVEYSTQAFLRGVISRNIFHPNKNAFDAFTNAMHNPESFKVDSGFYMLSAHEEYHNRLLISNKQESSGDSSYNISSAGLSSILNGTKLLSELLPDKKEQNDLLLMIRSIKKEYISTGEKLLLNWVPK
jgi:hypothetical protein